MRTWLLVTGLVAVALMLVFTACGDDDDHMGGMDASAPPGTIVVQLTNWAVEPSQSSVGAGQVTFRAVHPMAHMHASNEGGNIHDLAVARKNADGSFDILGQVKDIRMGRSKDLKLTLSPGEYELQCNVVEEVNGKMISHYIEGMRTPFTVS